MLCTHTYTLYGTTIQQLQTYMVWRQVLREGFESIRSRLRMSYNDKSAQSKQPKPGYFRQYKNPGKDVSGSMAPYGHLTNIYQIRIQIKQNVINVIKY